MNNQAHDAPEAIVKANYGKEVIVLCPDGHELTCELAVDLGDKPVPGDHVRYSSGPDGIYLTELLPRTRVIRRAGRREGEERILAAHVDCMAIVSSVRPEFKEGLVDRYLVIAAHAGIEPLLVLNKTDLDDGSVANRFKLYNDLGYETITTCALQGTRIDTLADLLRNRTTVLVGHSGVGKSTLLMNLLPQTDTATSEVSDYSGKGVHTTSTARMWVGDRLRIIDSPGIRSLGLTGIEYRNVRDYFVEFQQPAASCRFRDCLHIGDSGCAVAAAVERGEITQVRYDSYVRMVESLR